MSGESPLLTARFAQRTYRATFSEDGYFAGRSVDEVADEPRAGVLTPADVEVNYVRRGGYVLLLDSRSAMALELAAVPRTDWLGIDRTGDPFFEALVSQQLARNRLTDEGIMTVRRSGAR